MEGDELRAGKRRVREELIEPLERGGMRRKSGAKVEDHEAFLAGIEARLAYMTRENLAALREVVERYAGGKLKDIWPGEVPIINWARRLQEPPVSQSRLVRSYLQSGAGSAAAKGGYVVELFDYLKKYGQPPNTYSISEIRRRAEDNARWRARVRRLNENGDATPSEMAELHAYYERRRLCLDIIKGEGAAA